jgi:hypothetical protein
LQLDAEPAPLYYQDSEDAWYSHWTGIQDRTKCGALNALQLAALVQQLTVLIYNSVVPSPSSNASQAGVAEHNTSEVVQTSIDAVLSEPLTGTDVFLSSKAEAGYVNLSGLLSPSADVAFVRHRAAAVIGELCTTTNDNTTTDILVSLTQCLALLSGRLTSICQSLTDLSPYSDVNASANSLVAQRASAANYVPGNGTGSNKSDDAVTAAEVRSMLQS